MKLVFRRYISLCLVVGLGLSLYTGNLFAGKVALAWNPSQSSNLGGYKVYYGQSSHAYTSTIDAGKNANYQITGLKKGAKYYFAVSAYDSTRTQESKYSSEIFATAQPLVDFAASTTSGNASLVVNFTPNLDSPVIAWRWSWGDGTVSMGTTSTVPNMVKAYGNPGSYTVTLTALGSGWSKTTAKSNLITVTTPPWATKTLGSPSYGNNNGTTDTDLATTAGGNTSGLVAAYGFDESSGSVAADASGLSNHGAILNPVHVTGRSGNALKFDGVSAWVTVNNSQSLALSTGMTLEAWVYPTTWMNGAQTIVMKEGTGAASYLLNANDNSNQPMSAVWTNNEVAVGGNSPLPPNQWTHLAATYNGQYQNLYVNGILVNTMPQTAPIVNSTGLLRIGGNSVWGGYFKGYIDEMRIYNRALGNTEIIKDSATSISTAKPPGFIAGDPVVEPMVVYSPTGVAQAFLVVPKQNKMATRIRVFVDSSSTATGLTAAIYTNNAGGHPYTAISAGKQNVLKPNAWNSIPITPQLLSAGQDYWIAILGTGGAVNLRGQAGDGPGAMETSASTSLTNLPGYWSTGGASSNYGAVSAYVAGY